MQEPTKEEAVSQSTPSVVRSISEAIVIKDENLFCISHRDGSIPSGQHHGFGLYYNDCRYLRGYALSLGGTRPNTLVSNATREYTSVLQLTNEAFPGLEGHAVRKEQLGVKWKRVINGDNLTLQDTLVFQNFGLEAVVFEAAFDFEAGFEDVFSVRGFMRSTNAHTSTHTWLKDRLTFSYEGEDKRFRNLSIRFAPEPTKQVGTQANYTLRLDPQGSQELIVTFRIRETDGPEQTPEVSVLNPGEPSRKWLTHEAKVETDDLTLNRAMARSFRDLRVLESRVGGHRYFAAGIPWFATLFGRDSLITAFQTLAYNPTIAEQTLRLLASYQGKKVDEWRDEAPGKILHELRFGELARLNLIPHTPYYGTVDATPLFLSLIARHAQWTGDLTLFKELRPSVDAALGWMHEHGDSNGMGYLTHSSYSKRGLSNQGWKDSWDAIVNVDGSLATPPIALVEVQGYAYEAMLGIAGLYDRVGEGALADKLRQQAKSLRERFNREFWMEDAKCYALALQKGKKPVGTIASNAGHALWSGIADPEKARLVSERLMKEDMFGGWGIRTFSEKEKRYNPLGYHLGTVWPHDNSLIAAGFKRYGLVQPALEVFNGIFRAATYFESQRLPELFAGFSEKDYGVPVHYPVACHPQAWAAGTIPYLLEVLLGLAPDAFTQRLRIVRPMLPEMIDRLEFRDLQVGEARVDLGFYRTERRSIAVEVLNQVGPLEVIVEPGISPARMPL